MKKNNGAKLFGIELRINPSWFIVFLLVTILLANQFGQSFSDWSLLLQYSVGLVTSFLFFASVVAHELAHSLVARIYQIRVQSITLHLFGGVAQMEREPGRPREEFFIAAAGPALSLLLGGFFGGIWFLTKDMSAIISAPAFHLGIINVVLAVFNLIPGFPLDGGRILRALVWALSDNFRQATRVAAWSGQLVAALFIMFALYRVMSGDFQGLWLALIGIYLLNMAKSSYQQVELQYALRGLKVGSILLEELPQISGRLNVADFLDHYVLGTRNRHYMIVDDNVIRGVVSLRQMQNLDEKRRPLAQIEEVMTPINDLQRVGPETEIMHALELMSRANVSQLPVVKNDELLGFVGRDALLNYIRSRFEFGL